MPRVAMLGGCLHAVEHARDINVVRVHEAINYEPEFAKHTDRITHAPNTGAKDALALLHRARPFERVLCTTDLGNVPAADVAQVLGSPHTPAAARIIKNKVAVQKTLAHKGIDADSTEATERCWTP